MKGKEKDILVFEDEEPRDNERNVLKCDLFCSWHVTCDWNLERSKSKGKEFHRYDTRLKWNSKVFLKWKEALKISEDRAESQYCSAYLIRDTAYNFQIWEP